MLEWLDKGISTLLFVFIALHVIVSPVPLEGYGKDSMYKVLRCCSCFAGVIDGWDGVRHRLAQVRLEMRQLIVPAATRIVGFDHDVMRAGICRLRRCPKFLNWLAEKYLKQTRIWTFEKTSQNLLPPRLQRGRRTDSLFTERVTAVYSSSIQYGTFGFHRPAAPCPCRCEGPTRMGTRVCLHNFAEMDAASAGDALHAVQCALGTVPQYRTFW